MSGDKIIMYAVIKTGGKQYRVAEGDVLNISKLNNDLGDKVIFDEVLMVSNNDNTIIGTPTVKKATVEAIIKSHNKSKKVMIVKFHRRKHHIKRQGHRQDFTQVEISKISI